MFKSVYQGGAHVEVFSAQGKDPVANWKLHGKASAIRKEYDQDLRGFVYVLEGGSTVTRMQLPKNDRQHLTLLQPFFVLQVCIPEAANVSVELCISDGGGSRRRIFLSSAHKETSSTPLHARVPLSSFPRGEWFNLCIDLTTLVPKLFRGQQFKSVESVTVGGSCRLRRVFTLKTKPTISGDVPTSCTIPHFTSQKIILVPGEVEVRNDEALINSDGGTPDADKPSHVAFGTKIQIPDHILKTRMTSRNSDSSTTSAMSVHSDSGMMTNRKDHKSSSFSTKRALPKIQHKKVVGTPRLLPTDNTELNTVNDNDSSKVAPRSTPAVYSPSTYTDDHVTSHDAQEDDTVDGDTQLAIDVLRSQSDPSILYHYSSHPHSAQRRSPNASNSLSSDRGPCMDDDFYSSGSSSSVGDGTVEVSPSHVQRIRHQPKPPEQSDIVPSPTNNTSPVPLLRLSQVYDWRQYQSDITKADREQAGLPVDKEVTPHHSIIVGTMDSDEDTSLSGTMTGWNGRLLETPVRTSLDDTLERVISPDTLTRSLEQPLLPAQNLHKQGEELSLEYDPCLNCFYDPKSAKYYQLK